MSPQDPKVAPFVAEQINARIDQWKSQTGYTRAQILDDAARKTLDRSGSALARQIKQGFDSIDEFVTVAKYFNLDPAELLAAAVRSADGS